MGATAAQDVVRSGPARKAAQQIANSFTEKSLPARRLCIESDPGVAIEFREKGRPTFISTAGGRDLPVRGRFWVREVDGTVLKSELDAVDTGVEAHITVVYEHDAGIGLFAPSRMEERYRRGRDPIEIHGVATYSRFRRFKVTTSEELAN